MKKRILALILSILCMLPVVSGAVGTTDIDTGAKVRDVLQTATAGSSFEDIESDRLNMAADLMNTLGIMGGTADKTFSPDAPITRIDAISAFLRLLNVDSKAFYTDLEGVFYDVEKDDPYYSDICAAVAYRLVSGYSDNTVRPNNPLSYDELMVMATVVLGYREFAEQSGGYPTGYLRAIATAGLASYLTPANTDSITRGEFLWFLFGMADTEVYADAALGNQYIEQPTVFAKYHDVYAGEGLMQSTPVTALGGFVTRDNMVTIDGLNFSIKNDKYNSLIGNRVKYWYRDENADLPVLLFAGISDKVEREFVSHEDYINYSNQVLEYYTDTKKESATIATDAEFIVNGLVSAVKDVKAQLSAPNAFITLIDNDQNGNYEVVSIDRYTNLWMRGVSYTGDGLRFTWNFDLAATEVLFGGGVLVEMFDKDGNKIEYNKPAEGQYDADGNVVMVYDLSMIPSNSIVSVFADKYVEQRGYSIPSKDASYIKMIISDSMVEGTLNEENEDGIAIDDVFYPVSNSNFLNEASGRAKIGNTGKFYLDAFGEVVAFSKTDGTGADFTYGYLININPEGGLTKTLQIKLMTYDGEVKVFDCVERFRLNDKPTEVDEAVTNLGTSAKMLRPDFTISQPVQYKINAEGKISDLRTVLQRDGLPLGADPNHIHLSDRDTDGNHGNDIFGILYFEKGYNDGTGFYFKPRKYMNVPNIETFKDEDYFSKQYADRDDQFHDKEVEIYNVDIYRKPDLAVIYSAAGGGLEEKVWTNYTNSYPVMIKKITKKLDDEGMNVAVATVNTGAVEREYVGEDMNVFNGLVPGDVVYLYTKNHNTDIISKYERISVQGTILGPNAKMPNLDDCTTVRYYNTGEAYTAYGEVYAIDGSNIVIQAGPIVDATTGRRQFQSTAYLEGTRWQAGGTLVYDCSESKTNPMILNGTVNNIKSVYRDGAENASRLYVDFHYGASHAILVYNGMEEAE
ncbi:MAG: S-layer homology domain-containing protein [Ruminococcaceae bacterium]|nr:S-layer homology domain-containing protein [Oscillospiraceae bacterium]